MSLLYIIFMGNLTDNELTRQRWTPLSLFHIKLKENTENYPQIHVVHLITVQRTDKGLVGFGSGSI